MSTKLCIAVLLLLLGTQVAVAQITQALPENSPGTRPPEAPRTFQLLGLRVEGVSDDGTRDLVVQASGLLIGQMVTIPADPALAEAIRAVYKLRLFSDVRLVEKRRVGEEIYLAIQVQQAPRLAGYTFEGVAQRNRDKLKKKIPLLTGSRLRPGDIERARQAVLDFYTEKGYLLADAAVRRDTTHDGDVMPAFVVDEGPRVEVGAVVVTGNEAVSSVRLRKQMKETATNRWWRFWSKDTFDPAAHAHDLDRVVAYYHENGYYDARIVRDTVYVRQDDGPPEAIVEVVVHEGSRYYIRTIEWEGNTLFSDAELTSALGFKRGDPYNGTKLERNLFGNPHGTDVAGLYLNEGRLRVHVEPSVRVVDGDSLDLRFDVLEGTVYAFGEVAIAGNLTTKDHVIRRELATTPGQPFSRDAVQASIRSLVRLNYFEQTSLAEGPEILVDEEEQAVDLTYKVHETITNPLQIGGSFADAGLLLNLGLNFTNFSLQKLLKPSTWHPFPTGDGQQFSLGIQTSGRNYQRYALSFTEPWFRGRPAPLGFSVSYARLQDTPFAGEAANGALNTASARVFYDRRLQWLDDTFSLSTGVRYQNYENDDWTAALPAGTSQELVFRQALTRNSLDHPVFPTKGSLTQLSVELASPFAGFTQYHKWRFQTNWNVPLARKLTLGLSADFGYIGSLTGDDVEFQRFIVGGSPFDTQGLEGYFGRDVVYLRGYPAEAIGPRRDGVAVGGRVLNKYAAEVRWQAVRTPQLTAVPYLFMDAANTWSGFGSYDPSNLFRSAGVGVRFTLPILGLVDLNYGYRFDAFSPFGTHDGQRGWAFQISLGRIFGF